MVNRDRRTLWVITTILPVFLTGCHSGTQQNSQENSQQTSDSTPIIKGKSIPVSGLDKYLQSIDTSSNGSAKPALLKQDSLVLDGTTVTVGPVGAGRTVNLAFNKLKLINGARFVTNGNNLVIAANVFDLNNNDGVVSFTGDTVKAALDRAGLDGGKVTIYVATAVTGSLQVSLPGQNGGDGSPGTKGVPGGAGARGNDGVDGAFGCAHGGTDGAKGGTGGTGTPGLPGMQGGSGGNLLLLAEAVKNRDSHFTLQSPPGTGGTGGAGGPGGDGGPGGQGGSGSKVYCGGGHGGANGDLGNPGAKGNDGAVGKSPGKVEP